MYATFAASHCRRQRKQYAESVIITTTPEKADLKTAA
jgi:hypothetical protein